MGKLTRGNISLGEFYRLSLDLYKSEKVDDKKKRAKLDCISAKVNIDKNITYNKVTKLWEDINRRAVKFEFIVKTQPISYESKARIKTHIYPITFILYSIEDGLDTEFKYRSGSLKKPLFAPKGSTADKRLRIEEQNIRNGVDMWFFFHLEYALRSLNLLHGVCYANRPPKETNPKKYVYLEKHGLFVCQKLLFPIMNNPQAMSRIKKLVYKNEERIEKSK